MEVLKKPRPTSRRNRREVLLHCEAPLGQRAMESFFSSLKTGRNGAIYGTRDEAGADVFGYIERFYNSKRRHSTIGYLI
jgi:transposase InsO family protein